MIRTRIGRNFLIAAGVCLTVAVLGCGGGNAATGEVSGKITINGRPPKLKGLQIAFMAPNGRSFAAPVNEDGTFQASKLPAGEAKVSFVFVPPPAAPGKGPTKRMPSKEATDPREQASRELTPNPIPVPLQDGSTSNLTILVEADGSKEFVYDVKSP